MVVRPLRGGNRDPRMTVASGLPDPRLAFHLARSAKLVHASHSLARGADVGTAVITWRSKRGAGPTGSGSVAYRPLACIARFVRERLAAKGPRPQLGLSVRITPRGAPANRS
jgi:hypothetical protein